MAEYYVYKHNNVDFGSHHIIDGSSKFTVKRTAIEIVKYNVGYESLQKMTQNRLHNGIMSKNATLDKFIENFKNNGYPLTYNDDTGTKKTINISYDDSVEMVNGIIHYKHVLDADNTYTEGVNFVDLSTLSNSNEYKNKIAKNSNFDSLHKQIIKELQSCHRSIMKIAYVTGASDDQLIEYFFDPDLVNPTSFLPDIIKDNLSNADNTIDEDSMDFIIAAGRRSWKDCLSALERSTGAWTDYTVTGGMTNKPTYHCLGKFCEYLRTSSLNELVDQYVSLI